MVFQKIYTRIDAVLQQNRFQHLIRQSKYRHQLSELPSGLLPHWQRSAKNEFTGIPSDAVFFIQAAEGLMMFFDCVRRSEQACGLPSKAADSIWHAWLNLPQSDFKAQTVESFCRQHFGREIPHVEATQMESDMSAALAATLLQLRRIAGKDPLSHFAPDLFTLDRRLKMPRGYSYQMQGGRIGWQNMSLLGKGTGATFYPSSFEPAQLMALGLITAPMLELHQRKQAEQAVQQGGSCGSSGSMQISSCDSGSDGGCDGGSCGSGCGGGCS